MDFTDTDTSDTHRVTVAFDRHRRRGRPFRRPPADRSRDGLDTTLHNSTGTGAGSVDWNFAIADRDVDFLGGGETLTVNYNVGVKDAIDQCEPDVSVSSQVPTMPL